MKKSNYSFVEILLILEMRVSTYLEVFSCKI